MNLKENIRVKLVCAAKAYSYYINKKITVFINKYNKHFTIRFFETNFLHLTGVRTGLKAKDFYEKCLNNKITINDFNFRDNKVIMSNAIKKMRHLVNINLFFNYPCYIQKEFCKGNIQCIYAISNKHATIGFADAKYVVRPQTLLDGDCLNKTKEISEMKIKIKVL